MLDHVTIGVSDFKRSRQFYDQALHPLDIVRLYAEGESFAGYGIHPKAFFWIGRRDDVSTGAHIAFAAPDRQTVREFHHAALRAGYRDNGTPGERPRYHAGYYSAYVLDPDGTNVESVFRDRR